MAEPKLLFACLPTPSQMLLIEAALGHGDRAAAAWAGWEREFQLDHPDEGSFRLLPLVYRNLHTQGLTGPEWNRLKGIHRRAWSENQVLFHRVRPVLEELRAQDIPVMLLKGAALASLVYPDAGCRPMRDIDILVPVKRARDLFENLEARGWKPAYWRPREIAGGFLAFRHAMDFSGPEGGQIDLHWHALNLCCHEAADGPFWSHAEPLEFCGVPLLTCHVTEHLLQVLTHGIVWSAVPPVRWVADAVLLLRSDEAVDWQRLVATCRAWDLSPYVHCALEFLNRAFALGIPAWALDALERAPVSAATRAEFARACAPMARRTAWQDLLSFYARWRRSLGGASPALHAHGFVRHLQYAFELQSVGALPGLLVRSAVRRLADRQSA